MNPKLESQFSNERMKGDSGLVSFVFVERILFGGRRLITEEKINRCLNVN